MEFWDLLFPGYPPRAGVCGRHRQKDHSPQDQRPVLRGRHDRTAPHGEAVGQHRGQ